MSEEKQVLPPLPPDVRVIHVDDLKVLLREAAEIGATTGARQVLSTLGIKPDDEDAAEDLKELRKWVQAMRLAKRAALEALVRWLVIGGLSILLAGAIYMTGVKLNVIKGN